MQRKWLWTALGLFVILGLVWQFFPLSDASLRLQNLPYLGKGYIGRSLPLTDQEIQTFYNVGLLKRLYEVGKQKLFITVLDGTHNRHVVHDPFYCFRGSGWEEMSRENVTLPGGGDATLLQLKHNNERKEAIYWFSDGVQHYASPTRYWLQATLRRLTLGRSGAEPVLIVVQPLDESKLDWQTLLKQFPELLQL